CSARTVARLRWHRGPRTAGATSSRRLRASGGTRARRRTPSRRCSRTRATSPWAPRTWPGCCARRCGPSGRSVAEGRDVADDEELVTERVVNPGADELERAAEAALRPRRLAEFVGQRTVRDQLSLVLDAARARGRAPDHVLLAGPPGL